MSARTDRPRIERAIALLVLGAVLCALAWQGTRSLDTDLAWQQSVLEASQGGRR